VFVSLERCRRALLQEGSCNGSFLIPCGRASINDQSKKTTCVNGLLTSVVWHRALPPNFLDVSFCLTRGHIDWKEEGEKCVILPLD
jgi:hypothetical protein